MLEVFSSIDHVYSTVVTVDNCIAFGGSVLKQISEALSFNSQVLTKYAELCDYSDASSFSSTDVATCFQLLIFSRV